MGSRPRDRRFRSGGNRCIAPAASQQRTSQISLSSLVHFVKEQVRVTVQPSRRCVGGGRGRAHTKCHEDGRPLATRFDSHGAEDLSSWTWTLGTTAHQGQSLGEMGGEAFFWFLQVVSFCWRWTSASEACGWPRTGANRVFGF